MSSLQFHFLLIIPDFNWICLVSIKDPSLCDQRLRINLSLTFVRKPAILNGRMEDKAYLLALSSSGFSPRQLLELLQVFGSAEQVWQASLKDFARVPHFSKKMGEKFCDFRKNYPLEQSWERFKRSGLNLITLHEDEYPELLKTISDPPVALFYQGKLTTPCLRALAIVGSRTGTPRGKLLAKKLASSLAESGFTIISGLARGIDMAAHLGALEGGGQTWAVLGSGIDRIYPPENENLARRIALEGLIISEFPPGTPPAPWNFPQRNRIISGLSLGVIVVEAKEKSGALITARFALEQGREVFAIPGDPTSELSRGTNALIQDGAKLVQEIGDVLAEFPYLPCPKKTSPSLESLEEKILETLKTKGKIMEQLMKEVNLPIQQVAGTLLMLETKGLVSRLPGNLFVRT